ncbi:MAG: PEGA domain-containing protein [Spirochaetales bacterium]|uniref:PEGA domain-containing protein n=1 Tax=Candidatus Thalassospirochaeta sargassi TaxID=3119039 RepID=A0AAJ1IJX3_9SPIO|nr:PEGA domain-containing protein [Spirochaetales bacterium]
MFKNFILIAILAVAAPLMILQADGNNMTMSVGVFILEGDSEQTALSAGISSRIYEALGNIGSRVVEFEELVVLSSDEKQKEINANIVALEDLYAARDQLIFNSDSAEWYDDYYDAVRKIEDKQAEIDRLVKEKTLISDLIREGEETEASLELKKADDSLVFTIDGGTVSDYADDNDLDFAVYGYIETIDQYEYIEIRLWNNITDKDIFIWRTALDSDYLNDLLQPGLNGLKTALIGSDWAELSVRGPDNAMIYLNGQFMGIGNLNRMMITPGETEIELRKQGSKTVTDIVSIAPERLTLLEYEMDELEVFSVVIQTWPAGADVYLDSEWIGKSPVILYPETETSAVRISMEGWEDRSFFIDQETEKIVNINMKPSSKGRDEMVADTRKRFYTSMGSFILSIPLTGVFSAMLDQSASAYNRDVDENGKTNSDEQLRLINLNRAEYSLYTASLGLNIFLLADTIIQAVDYVGSVEYFSE